MDKEQIPPLDKSSFGKTIKMLAIKFPAQKTNDYLKEYREQLLNIPK